MKIQARNIQARKLRTSWWSGLVLGLGTVLGSTLALPVAQAQRGDSSSRGGDRGSSERSSSDRNSSDRGGDRSSRGGPPGGFSGGFGGGPPGGFSGGFGGGPPGSSGSFRGGPPGSSGGFSGGPPGGFSPVDMLRRFDRNGNNMIDMDEREGPARFFIERMAQGNSRIDINRPIPLDRLAAEMDRMRQERGGAPPGAPGSPTNASNKPAVPEPLVPGFDKVEELPPVLGFGLPDPNASIKVEERDLREADERLKRYDSNKDGVLTKEELANGRWSDDPMQYDRNGDGKINKNELAVRYAKRRLDEQSNGQASNNQGRSNGSSSQSRSSTASNFDPRSRFTGSSPWGGSSNGSPWGGNNPSSRGGDRGGDRGNTRTSDNGGGWGAREGGDRSANNQKKEEPKSYRSVTAREKANAVQGLPDWFARSDADADGQVLMREYSTTWTDEKVAEFNKFDLNGDGIITSRECLNALKNGSSSSSGIASTAIASTSTTAASSSSSASIVAPAGTSKDDANRDWAKRQIEKYDKNRDGQLTIDEWSSMIVKPEGADANKDGIVTLEEYVKFRSGK